MKNDNQKDVNEADTVNDRMSYQYDMNENAVHEYMYSNAPPKSCQTKLIFQHCFELEGNMELLPIYILSTSSAQVGCKSATTTTTKMLAPVSMLTVGFPLLQLANNQRVWCKVNS